ncbi:hypothetical protein M0804_012922 [Polistes exclamans]|nr:hypothetical protein M0804_012922 [Polistes exclamans]
MLLEYRKGLYICGFPSGSSNVYSQEIVLKCPRGYKAIRFRVEKEMMEHERKKKLQKIKFNRRKWGMTKRHQKNKTGRVSSKRADKALLIFLHRCAIIGILYEAWKYIEDRQIHVLA